MAATPEVKEAAPLYVDMPATESVEDNVVAPVTPSVEERVAAPVADSVDENTAAPPTLSAPLMPSP